MERTRDESERRSVDFPDIYLPAMPSMSNTPGRVEQFLTTLFRRRGRLRRVVR